MKRKKIIGMMLSVFMLSHANQLDAQTHYPLQELIDAAMKHNHILIAKEYQVQEGISKLKEDKIKKGPAPSLDATYQYSAYLPEIAIPAGSLGTIRSGDGTNQLLPAQTSEFTVGEKSTYNVGVNLYQPLSQQFKINTGLAIHRTEIKLLKKEKEKTALQLQLAIEELYYNALINQKQTESELARLALAKSKLYDQEGALAAGKTTNVQLAALRAEIAEQEQVLLKLAIQLQNYLGELGNLTKLEVAGLLVEKIEVEDDFLESIEVHKSATPLNPDIEIAKLNKEKAMLGVKAAHQNNLPDLGIIGGYFVQQGNPLLPSNSPYVGLSLKWNIQDLFANKHLTSQRTMQLKQSEERMAQTKQQIDNDINKVLRKLEQAAKLIASAKQLLIYRQEALKEQEDQQTAGMDIKTSTLEMKSLVADAEANLYAARLSKVLALAELRNLTGQVR